MYIILKNNAVQEMPSTEVFIQHRTAHKPSVCLKKKKKVPVKHSKRSACIIIANNDAKNQSVLFKE